VFQRLISLEQEAPTVAHVHFVEVTLQRYIELSISALYYMLVVIPFWASIDTFVFEDVAEPEFLLVRHHYIVVLHVLLVVKLPVVC
jgi:hypothetical protein